MEEKDRSLVFKPFPKGQIWTKNLMRLAKRMKLKGWKNVQEESVRNSEIYC